jgi:catechol 2,3-dioxygenase-like lactoylglutathione lyase family enzyme
VSGRVTALNHVSVVAHELETSIGFYVDELGLRPLPTPNFGFPVRWLQAGPMQVHLFERPGDPPSHAHFGLEVDDLLAVYRRMAALGALDHVTFGNCIYELPDGGVQLYVRDPAGNLVELDHPDASTVASAEIPEYAVLADRLPQHDGARSATLWHVAGRVS